MLFVQARLIKEFDGEAAGVKFASAKQAGCSLSIPFLGVKVQFFINISEVMMKVIDGFLFTFQLYSSA
ncbi:hypothetical protein [Pantoea sp. BAV 3049]|uniref:hypothetical protein n=1 Tax=Pantoea sp. BAV 3049 TaxID=2654188 RepID=UPI00131AE12A|nr:hypothetical protein [Pantoea sp. BAV 3049]